MNNKELAHALKSSYPNLRIVFDERTNEIEMKGNTAYFEVRKNGSVHVGKFLKGKETPEIGKYFKSEEALEGLEYFESVEGVKGI